MNRLEQMQQRPPLSYDHARPKASKTTISPDLVSKALPQTPKIADPFQLRTWEQLISQIPEGPPLTL